jgi:hypothetical protein
VTFNTAPSHDAGSALSSGSVEHRRRVARFWDEVIDDFLAGGFPKPPPLDRWITACDGWSDGAIDFDALPEPYAGPLLGDVRAITLGLNPGMVFPEWQHRGGILAEEIRHRGSYHEAMRTSPVTWERWLSAIGPVGYYVNRLRFMQRWNDDPSIGDEQFLTFELYPWHSKRVLGPMRPDPDIIDWMVFQPISEMGVRHVFAFGAEWFRVLDGLELPRELTLGKGGEPYPTRVGSRTIGVYRHDSDFLIVAEKHAGSAGPPSTSETELLQEALEARGLGR